MATQLNSGVCIGTSLIRSFLLNVVSIPLFYCAHDFIILAIASVLCEISILCPRFSDLKYWFLSLIKSLICATICRKDINLEYWFLVFIESMFCAMIFRSRVLIFILYIESLNCATIFRSGVLIFILYRISNVCHDFRKKLIWNVDCCSS